MKYSCACVCILLTGRIPFRDPVGLASAQSITCRYTPGALTRTEATLEHGEGCRNSSTFEKGRGGYVTTRGASSRCYLQASPGSWSWMTLRRTHPCRRLVLAVYLLDEILDIARYSPENAQGVAEHLVKRLAHKSPTVKFKVSHCKVLCLRACSSSLMPAKYTGFEIGEAPMPKGIPAVPALHAEASTSHQVCMLGSASARHCVC
jgi:hypothetical protein